MRLKKVILFVVLFFVLLPLISYSQEDTRVQSTTTFDLNGVFDGGGGKYYIRQLGNDILWYGEEDAVTPSWSNVAHGIINGDQIIVKWADVPKGSIMQSGDLVIKINSNNSMTLLQQTGEFFATPDWTRIP